MKNEPQLTRDPVPELVKRLAIPASVGYFFNTMYNVVDTYFGGEISTDALAALSLSLPVFFIIISLGSGVSTGCTALIGTALGRGDREEARLFSMQGLGFGFLLSVVVTVLGLAASPFLFRLLGAEKAYLGTALEYMNTIFAGTVFFFMVHQFNAVLQASGDTRSYRNFLILGFFMNVVLDPWFIYGGFGLPAMKFRGIALATVLVQVAGSLYIGWRAQATGLIDLRDLRLLRPRLSVYKEIARQGLPASVNMVTIGVGIFVITYFISRFGKEGVAAYGAAMRVEQIALLPTIGLNIATLSITAQNHGAGLHERIWETVRASLRYGAIVLGIGSVAVFALSRVLMTLFTDDPAVIDIGAAYLKIDALVLYAYVVLFVHMAALQGVKKPMFAVWIGLFRQIVAPLAVFYLLSQVLGWGLWGVWWGIFFVTWSAVAITVFWGRRILKRTLAPGRLREASD